ncbi:TATA element modulatory factor 1 [Blyttiomyces sp. JEL0837]|nr:TATA element modulatory factor 1 [Blyttiomyces sp. JEL0837]
MSWLNTLASSETMSWVTKAVSEVESRIDKVLDISSATAATPPTTIDHNPKADTIPVQTDVSDQAGSAAHQASAALSSGIRTLSTSISSSFQAAAAAASSVTPALASAAPDKDFFSSVLASFGPSTPEHARQSSVPKLPLQSEIKKTEPTPPLPQSEIILPPTETANGGGNENAQGDQMDEEGKFDQVAPEAAHHDHADAAVPTIVTGKQSDENSHAHATDSMKEQLIPETFDIVADETPLEMVLPSDPPDMNEEMHASKVTKPKEDQKSSNQPELNHTRSASHGAEPKARNQQTLGADDLFTLKTVIEQRERQLMTAMTENAALTDTVNILRNQMSQLENVKSEESARLDALVKEFSERLGASDKQLQKVIKERDQAQQQLTSMQNATASSNTNVQKQLEEKDEKIRLLIEEGEKMSKNELKISTNLKKLRAKEAEMDKEVKELTKKLELSASEIADLKEKVASLGEMERRQGEIIKSLREVNEDQARQIVKLENELLAAKDENTQLRHLLDRTRLDLQESRKQQAEARTAAQAEALEREIKANEELHNQLSELQKSSALAESLLRKESLHSRLQAANSRHEDFFAEARSDDRPLVRQIESLQNQHAIAQRDWEQIEHNLTIRLQQVEEERSSAIARERSLLQQISQLNDRCISSDNFLLREREEKASLQSQLDDERTQIDKLQKNLEDSISKMELLKSSHARAMEEAKEEHQILLKKKLEEERQKWDESRIEEKPRTSTVIKDRNEMVASENRRTNSIPSTPSRIMSFSDGSVSPSVSVVSRALAESQSQSQTDMNMTTSNIPLNGPPSIVIDRLHTNVKQLQGQISTLQTRIQLITQTRDELAEELMKVMTENTEIKSTSSRLDALEKDYAELNRRYMACLELLGEKTEQVEEMQTDVEEMKRAYRTQVQDLLTELDHLRAGKSKE